jgi:hypothetical protein
MTKRGRKKKEEYYKTKKADTVVFDTKVIIHLPISLDDIQTYKNRITELESKIISQIPGSLDGYYDEDKSHYKEFDPKQTSSIVVSPVVNPSVCLDTEDIYNLKLIPESISCNDTYTTKIHCWWCCHSFDNSPVFLPTNLYKDRYKVKGIFCSFECVFAYLTESKTYSDKKYLLNYYFRDITKNRGSIDDHIKRAPKRELLQIFGGPLSIEQFRQHNTKITYHPYPQTYVVDQMRMRKGSGNISYPKKVNIILPPKNVKEVEKTITNNLNKILRII